MRSVTSLGLAIALVAALLVVVDDSSAVADPCGPAGNQITCENSKPGVAPAVWDISGAGDSTIQGFSTDISVNVGNRVDFKVDTDAANYSIDIYRTGWYQGLGARKIASVTPSAALPQLQPQCISDVTTELYDCGTWAVSASWDVPATAVSGVYVALLTRSDTGGQSHITFIVRDIARQSDVLFQTSDPTWQAYNVYGGSSFYQGAANRRAYKLSYNRPFATRAGVTARDFYFASEYPAVRFLEQNGYDVTYFSGVDTDRFGGELLNHKVFLSVGHDEYWSGRQRSNVEAARDAGVNLQFLSGNEVYWRTRYEPSVDGAATPYRTLVSYKETRSNGKIDPSPEWTGTWRDPRFASLANGAGNPENGLTGTMYMSNFTDLPVTVTAEQGKTRMWRNTTLSSLAAGASAALAPHTVGYESNEDVDNGFRPPGLIRLSTTVGASPEYLQDFGNTVAPGTTTHHSTLYRAPSGALVFSAGSIQWTWGLDQVHDGNGAAADPRMRQAQVNILADMGAQPASIAAPLVAAQATTDLTAPQATIQTPSSGATVPNGSPVTVSGTASDTGGRVAGVEVSTDGGTSWHPATGTANWTYQYNQQGYGNQTVQVRAIDDSGNYPATGTVANLTVTGPFTVFGAEQPSKPDAGDTAPAELGLRFTPTVDGFVSGVRFFKSSANGGTHTGTLWSATGTQLQRVTFTGETASGWQTATFTNAVAVTAGQTYVISYSAPSGRYSSAEYYWSYRGKAAGPLTVAGGFGTQPAGVYSKTVGAFPGLNFRQANYYVDAVFTLDDTSPLVATNQRPIAGSSSVPTSTTIGATLSRPIEPASLAMTVKDAQGTAVAGTTTYDATTRNATFTPTAALRTATTYTVTLAARDMSGSPLTTGGSWTFTTAPPPTQVGVCPCSLFDEATTPQVLDAGDNQAVTLGVRFAASSDGVVSGIKFYKGPGNTGTHTGALWSATGTLLASAVFTNESSSGWQTVTFTNPVSITAGTQYTASYRTTVGRYSTTSGQFTTGYTRGPLSVPAKGGSFTYGTGFPNVQIATGYLVDLIFQPASTPVSVVSLSPANGATEVDFGTPITATLSGAVRDGYQLSATVGGAAVAGTTTLSADRKVITFQPSNALPAGQTVNVSLSGVVSSTGEPLPTQSWSFTTAETAPTRYSLLTGRTPVIAAAAETLPVELGMSFTTSTSGSVTAIKFYKGTGNSGTHTGSLWSAAGQRLATVTFSGETATGWQTALLGTPVALTPGQTYVVSYFAPNGRYSSTTNFFQSPLTSGPLTAGTQGNGRYFYGSAGGFPNRTWQASNYFVDVVFSVSTGGSTAPVTVVSTTPANQASNVAVNTAIDAQLSAAPTSGTPTIRVSTASGSVAGSSAFDTTTQRVTFTPSAALTASTAHTATVEVGGTALTGGTWTFTTATQPPPPPPPPPPVTVTATTPGANATGVSPTQAITAQLSAEPSATPTLAVTSPSGAVAGSSDYDAATRTVTFTPVEPLAWSTTHTATVSVAGTTPSGGAWSFTTAAEPPSVDAVTIFAANGVPDYPAWADVKAAQVGVRFSSTVAGSVTGIRFYKGAQNTGSHQGYLWSNTGAMLATVTFGAETGSGWQTATFSQPVAIQPGVEYRASYHSTVGRYAVTLNGLTAPVTSPPLATPSQGGVYLYGTNYPTNLSPHNYWVDVFFVPSE